MSSEALVPRPKRRRARRGVTANESGSTQLTRYQIQAVEKVYRSVPPDEIHEALQHSPDPRAERLLEVMQDNAYAQHSFAMKCKAAGIPPAEVWRAVINHHKLDAEIRVARKLPEVMTALADDAMPKTVTCSRCTGKGQIMKIDRQGATSWEDCRPCNGQGKIITAADNEARKMTLEAAGVIGQRGPLIDARQVHMGGSGGSGFAAPDMSDWTRSSDDIFEERGRGAASATPIDTPPIGDDE